MIPLLWFTTATNYINRWGLEKVLYMANYNFLRGYEVYDERTLSLVTYGYQETAAYLESVLLQANQLQPTNEMMRTALYISALKETYRIEVMQRSFCEYAQAMRCGVIV